MIAGKLRNTQTTNYNKTTPLKLVPPLSFSGNEFPARVEMRARGTIVADPPHGPAHAPPLARVAGPVCRVPEVLELAPRALEARRRVRAGLCGNQPVCRVHPTILH